MSDTLQRLAAALTDRYRIERELGAGGMATVYLAQDIRHDRRVAIKVLRPELAAVIGAERFLSEIKTTANLQHPHILSLFDSGTVDGTVFYVMPFVEGESLRDRLAREKQLPVDEALRISREVADALQYAHQHGVIHRDIKPENILLQGGHALVADFGIALAAAKTGGSRMTETGMSLGTPQYMSPEQAMGERELDARADIYALGCVTYEMLAGEPPFTGPTAQSVVAKVLTEPPPGLRLKRPSVPEHVEDAVVTALQKLPADRFRSAGEFATALQDGRPGRREDGRGTRRTPAVPSSRLPALAIIAAALVAAFYLGGKLLGRRAELPLVFGRETHVTWDPGLEVTPAISPDGRSVAYAAGLLFKMHVMVRPVGEGRAVALTGDTANAETDPRWSPDGSRVLFLSRGGVWSAPAGGGPARPELPGTLTNPVLSADWSPDGKRLVITRGDSLLLREVDASVHGLARIADPSLCVWSPQGTFVACVTQNSPYSIASSTFGNLAPSRIMLCRVSDGTLTMVSDTVSLNQSPVWSADGRWLYFVSNRDGPRDIYGVPITGNGHTGGPTVRLSTGLGAHTISLTPGGSRLAYSKFSVRKSIWSMPIPASPGGTGAGMTRITNNNEYIEVVAVSTDGKWLFYDSDLAGNSDIFRLALAGGEPERLTTNAADDFFPSPSPDGKEVAFHSWRSGSRDLWVMRLDGGGEQQVTSTKRQEALPNWSPTGNAIAFGNLETGNGIGLVRRDANGRWGEPVQRAPGGTLPTWSPDGRSILYTAGTTGGSLVVVPADSGPERTLFDASVPGAPFPEAIAWASTGLVYFQAHDPTGATTFWSMPAAGGAPKQLARLDPAIYPSSRLSFAIGNGRFYFPVEDHQSDIWVMELGKP
ncbi:MAG TPA: protein kinase [Gemmatimonadales bacterium]|nr:protein kinase [Gemmatimonadales bacterium]